MKVYNTLLFFLAFVLPTYAQQESAAAYAEDTEFSLWNLQESDTSYVFTDKAYIREQPNTQSTIKDSLLQGMQLVVDSPALAGSIIRGFYAPWYKISYTKNNIRHEGFIWSGLLALNSNVNQKGELFIYGFNRFKPDTDFENQLYVAELKVFNAEKALIAKNEFHATVHGQSFTEAKILPNMGLENIENISRMSFLSEGCGIPTLNYYFAWNGHELIRFPDKTSVGDAGVFYVEEKILFPSEHQIDPSLIYKDTLTGECIDIDADELEYKETSSRQTYRWDGHQLWEIQSMK